MLWPTESADQVLLQWSSHPKGNRTSTTSNVLLCKLVYDETHHYIRIVDHITNNVLDTIDVYDIIGANVSINMNNKDDESSSKPRVMSDTTVKGENTAPKIDAIPTDTQAHSTLSIYVYPRKPPKPSSSLIKSFYRSTSKSDAMVSFIPTPNYERPMNFNNNNYGTRYDHHRTLMIVPLEDLYHLNIVVNAIQHLATYHPIFNSINTTTASSSLASKSPTLIPPRTSTDIANTGTVNNMTTSSKNTTTSTTNHKLHYVIICNPKSGPNRNADIIANKYVIPMLEQANIDVTLCITTHPGHAVELCHLRDETPPTATTSTNIESTTKPTATTIQRLESDITYYNGIIVMGGDGTIHEVIQGIKSRTDAQYILTNIPIGVIGCGTANGLATSLSYTSYMYNKNDDNNYKEFMYHGVMDDIFAIVKGFSVQADLSTYTILTSSSSNDNKTEDTAKGKDQMMIKQYTSFLTYSYGIIAEIDIESERIYWMGQIRFDLWGVVRILFLRKYKVKFSYTTEPIADTSTVPLISDPIPSTWTTIEDNIILFWASQVSHAGSKVYSSPPSKTSDGLITIFLIRGNVSRLQLFMILLGLENGSHVTMKGVEWIRCTAYRVEPIDKDGNTTIRTTFNNIDGEMVESGPIQGVVEPKAIRYFIAPPDHTKA